MLRWLTSPLAGTAGVIAGLGLVSIPLRQLTSAPPVQMVKHAGPVVSGDEIPAVLRLKLLAPAKSLRLKTSDGITLLDIKNLEAGDTEHDAVLRLIDDACDMIIVADFGVHAAETAVFLTVMPDGLEEQTHHVIGSGLIEETLRYAWRHTH
jgi:hypothetical protein